MIPANRLIKRHLLIILSMMVIAAVPCRAQTSPSLEYTKSERMNKFAGTWEWKVGDSSFTVVLTKAVRMEGGDYDVLYGQYRYSRKGEKVADYIGSTDIGNNQPIIAHDRGDSILELNVRDTNRYPQSRLKATFTLRANGSAVWKSRKDPSEVIILVPDKHRKDNSLAIPYPLTWVMRRIN